MTAATVGKREQFTVIHREEGKKSVNFHGFAVLCGHPLGDTGLAARQQRRNSRASFETRGFFFPPRVALGHGNCV